MLAGQSQCLLKLCRGLSEHTFLLINPSEAYMCFYEACVHVDYFSQLFRSLIIMSSKRQVPSVDGVVHQVKRINVQGALVFGEGLFHSAHRLPISRIEVRRG